MYVLWIIFVIYFQIKFSFPTQTSHAIARYFLGLVFFYIAKCMVLASKSQGQFEITRTSNKSHPLLIRYFVFSFRIL